jgi:hypothetical protein
MSDLQNQTPADTYKGLLQVGDYTNGVDANSEYIQDGEGTNSVLSISTTKVGVGTVSPSAELDVVGGIEATTLTTSGSVTAGSIDVSGNVVADEYALDQTGTSSSAVAIHAPATNELAIRTNSTEAMRITSDGNVGIGITSPNISGGAVGSTTLTLSASTGVNSGKSAALELRGTRTTLGHLVSSVQAYNNSGTTSITSINSLRGDSDTEGELEFVTSNSPAMRITADSNVGIGTDSPSAPLEVASTTGGVIMPRMNDSQRDAISSPTNGEMIFNTSTNKLNVYNGTAWRELTDTAV